MKYAPNENHLIGLSLCFFLLLNYPIISIFNYDGNFLGIPILFVYFFSSWAAFVLLIAFIAERPRKDKP